jgi:hypothetical protein
VLVDSKGIPYGTMKKVMESEVKLLAKDLDPRYSWEGQPQHAKDRFFKRVYAGISSPMHVKSLYAFGVCRNIHLNIPYAAINMCCCDKMGDQGEGQRQEDR